MDSRPAGPPPHHPAGLPAVQAVDPNVWLSRLRADHPDWAFVYDPFAPRWVAVRGRHEVLDASTAFELADALATTVQSNPRGFRPWFPTA